MDVQIETVTPLKDAKVTHVTVFADRAEVTRQAIHLAEAPGTHSLILTGLPDKVDTDSIRVKVLGSTTAVEVDADGGEEHKHDPDQDGGAAACKILEVSVKVNHRTPDQDIEDGPKALREAAAREALEAAEAELTGLKHAAARLKQRDTLVQGYLQSMLVKSPAGATSNAVNNSNNPVAPAVGSDLKVVTDLLKFHAEQGADLDREQFELKKKQKDAQTKVDAAKLTMNELRVKANQGPRTSNDVQILVSVPAAHTTVQLQLTYIVHGASWHASYDIRVEEDEQHVDDEIDVDASLGDEESSKSQLGRASKEDGDSTKKPKCKTMAITYFGVVKQNCGEDWEGVALSLSTAVPSRGGCPPLPPTRKVEWKSPVQAFGARARGGGGHGMMSNMMIPVQSAMPMRERQLSISAAELDGLSESEYSMDDEDGQWNEGPAGGVETAAVRSAQTGSSSFNIQRKATILADSKEHKVTIAIVDVQASLRYFATPELEEVAYLQARGTNTSQYPFLACRHGVSVFNGGQFVTKTALKHTSPGEAFNVFLGVDAAIKVEHRLVTEKFTKGSKGSAFKSKQPSSKLYEYRTIVCNNKGQPIDLTLVELMPKSNDEQITVKLLEPPRSEVKISGEDKDKGGSTVDGANSMKENTVVQNKVTNNVVRSMNLAAGSKTDITFKYCIFWPFDEPDVRIV